MLSLCNGTGTDNVAAMWEGVNCLGVDFSPMMHEHASKYEDEVVVEANDICLWYT